MGILEILTLTLAPVIAKSVLKLWLKDQSVAVDISSSLIGLLDQKVKDVVVRQNAKRQLEEVGEKVAISLMPVFNDSVLSESSKEAVALAVSATFDKAPLSAGILAQNNLDPYLLYKYLCKFKPSSIVFSDGENQFYERILEQSASYIVDISDLFPNLRERTLAEVLKRERELIEVAEFVLAEVQRIRLESQRVNPDQSTAFFEESYRRSVVRALDRPDIFGLTNLSRASQRYRISVAYISLSVTETRNSSSNTSRQTLEREKVEHVLSRTNKLIIRGQAGSGKTTLLKWLAVNSSNRGFSDELVDWNSTIPFFIPLRKFVNAQLPSPEDFVKVVAPEIAGTMPYGWVHDCLDSKRALVLVDGVDEIPNSQRNDVHDWLDSLIDTYPNVRFVISSRPYAISQGWLSSQSFAEADLQSMELQDIYAFIDHWHQAIEAEVDSSPEEIAQQASSLRDVILSNRSIFALATNPLLCAALCALHRDRHRHIPSSRIEIYDALCEMLLERREKERRIILEGVDYPELTYPQKRVILESLAYWMVLNNWSTVSTEQVDRHISRKIKSIVGLPSNTTEASIRRLLTDRSGILREPTIGSIDFVHRTMQEFLAARALLDNEDIGVIKNNLYDDQWHQVIILASGLAGPKIRESIIKDIIRRGGRGSSNRHKLYLLAVSCLENAVELSQNLQEEIKQRLSDIVPPRDENDVDAIAAAKDLAVPFLSRNSTHSNFHSRLCIDTLAKIGSEAAFSALKSYVDDRNPGIVDALVMAGRAFDEIQYKRHITSHLSPQELSISGMITLATIKGFVELTSLSISNCIYLTNLNVISEFTYLRALHLEGMPRVTDLAPLAACEELGNVSLVNLESVSDLSVLASFERLKVLKIRNLSKLNDLSQFTASERRSGKRKSPKATVLWLSGLSIDNFTPLENWENLTELYISDLSLTSLKSLAKLSNLKRLHMDGIGSFDRLDDLVRSESIEEIFLGRGFHEVNIPKKLLNRIRTQ